MTTRVVLTFESDDKKEIRFFKTVNEAKNAIFVFKKMHPDKYRNFQIKVIKPF